MVEQQKKTMGNSPVITESTVMAVNRLNLEGSTATANPPRQGTRPGSSQAKPRFPQQNFQPRNNSSSQLSGLVCYHCGDSGHSKSRCYEIIGYLDWWDFKKKPWKNIGGKAAITTVETSQETDTNTLPQTNVTQTGNLGRSLNVIASTSNTTWIIDTCASDHMTNNPHVLKSIKPSSQTIISTADGSPSPVTGEGSITLSPSLTLETVLIVPSLAYSLLSVCQITAALSCLVIFWPTFCMLSGHPNPEDSWLWC